MWLIYELLFILFIHLTCVLCQSYHHSNAGEYFLEWNEIGPCPLEKSGTNENFANVHLTRKNRKPEIVGNVSLSANYDDTTPLKVDFSVLGKNSAWIPHFYSMSFSKGCTDGLIGLFEEGWTDFLKSLNMPPSCPMKKGFYQTKGFNPDNFLKSSALPKRFIYGRYKVTLEYYNNRNRLMGCNYFIIDVLPLWQKKKKQSN